MLKYPINVTIDTNVFYAAKYDFSENSPLKLLSKYVREGKIKVVLSDIVIKESKKHLATQVNKVCSIARSLRADALNISTEYLITHVGLTRLLELVPDKNALKIKAQERFDQFIQDINAEILGSDLINIEPILVDYFEVNPPFEEGEKKRKEFPDAFIAYQIRKRFGEDEVVAIISKDDGFKKACKQTTNQLFFNSLGELYNKINEETAAYNKTLSLFQELQTNITSAILEHIEYNENIEVHGLSCDKDGITSGFDYDEFYLHNITDASIHIHSVDELSGNTSMVTLLCNAKISVDCFYEDYDNAPWDPEIKGYILVDRIQIREDHNARFGCRIQFNLNEKTYKILPFTVILGGDSRKTRCEVQKNENI